MRVAVGVERIGPYHQARLRAAAGASDVVAIEYQTKDNTYGWREIEGNLGFPRVTMFPDRPRTKGNADLLITSWERVLHQARPDVVAIPGWFDPISLAGVYVCGRLGIPVVVMSDSTEIDKKRHPAIEAIKARILSLFSAAVVGGHPHKRYMEKLGFPGGGVFLGYDVVDNGYFEHAADQVRADGDAMRRAEGLPERYFLAISRFIEKKNFPMLLEAYAAYRKASDGEPVALLILGDGELKPLIEESVARLNLQDAVRLPGFIQYDKLPVYLALADALILPSTSEQWGLVVNEAMAAGLPVLVSERCGCAEDLVEKGGNGYPFDPENVDQLALQMQIVAADRQALMAMGVRSREIIARWSPTLFAESLLNACRYAMAEGGRPLSMLDRLAVRWLVNR